MRTLSLLIALSAPSVALAGSCDTLVSRAQTASGAALVAGFKAIANCDLEMAKTSFPQLMLRATDLDTLQALGLAAIQEDAFVPVWDMMGKVPYEHRQALAQGVGAACATQPKVVPFLQGAYVAMKGTEFVSWSPALESCTSTELTTWMEGALASPPPSTYNEKYNAIVSAWGRGHGIAGLAALEKGAVAAGANGGPFSSLVDAIIRTSQPASLRDQPRAEDVAAVEAALVRVAKAVPPEAARVVADRLATSGNVAAAASLLPTLYPDAASADGNVRWAAAAIEACEGEAVVYWTTWMEAPTRVDVLEPAKAALSTLKPKLKCTAPDGWLFRASESPVGEEAVDGWVDGLVSSWNGQGFKTKDKQVSVTVTQ